MMKRLCLLLTITTSITHVHSHHWSLTPTANVFGHPSVLVLRGGDDDDKPRHRKRKRRPNEAKGLENTTVKNVEALLDDAEMDSNVPRKSVKKRKRKKRGSAASDDLETTLESDDIASSTDVVNSKKKRRRKRGVKALTESIEDPLTTETLDDTEGGGDQQTSAKKRRRRRRKHNNVSIETGAEVVLDGDENLNASSSEVEECTATDNTSMKKKRRKKRKKSTIDTDEDKDAVEPVITTEMEMTSITVDEQFNSGDEITVYSENESLREAIVDSIQDDDSSQETASESLTSIDDGESAISLDQSSFTEETPHLVSIDTTIEIPEEEVVPESIFSAVEMNEELSSEIHDESFDLNEKSGGMMPVQIVDDSEETTTSSNIPDTEDTSLTEALEESILTETSEEPNIIPTEAISIETTIEIPNEEVVPESVFSAMEMDDSLSSRVDEVELPDISNADLVLEQEVIVFDEIHSVKDDASVGLDELPIEVMDDAVESIDGEVDGSNDKDEMIAEEETSVDRQSNVDDVASEDDDADATNDDDDVVSFNLVNGDSDADVENSSEIEVMKSQTDNEQQTIDTANDNKHEDSTEVPKDASEQINLESTEGVDNMDEECLTLSVVTWNLGEAAASEKEASFIRQFRQGSDLVMIGAQECEDIKPRRAEGHRSRHLRKLGIQMLGEDYVPLAIHSLGGIQMALYCRREKLNDVEFIGLADVTCGVGNVFHNKGAIGVYLKLKQHSSNSDEVKTSKVLLVTGHLAAHVKNVDARNDDFRRIMSELEVQAPTRFLKPKKNRDGSLVEGDGSYLLDSMDHVIFAGDLNYRIDLPREYVDRCIDGIQTCELDMLSEAAKEQRDTLMKKLLRRDQLLRTISSGRAFANFNEGKIAFLPTFKFDKGSSLYDTSYKQRIPAWTDRIVFKSDCIKVLKYDSVPKAMHSDHRPVFGTFQLGWGKASTKRVNKPKRKSRR